MLIMIAPTNSSAGRRSRSSPLGLCLALTLWAVLLAGCAMWPTPTRSTHIGAAGPLGSCADFFAALDKQTARTDALDAGYFRVANYPYLRTDRFLASFRNEAKNQRTFGAWVEQMQHLDQSARRSEIADLPDAAVAAMGSANGRRQLDRQVETCGNQLKKADFSIAANRNRLRQAVSAPDEYLALRRVLGIYPITRLFVSHGVHQWQARARGHFSAEPPPNWQVVRYMSAAAADPSAVHRIFGNTRRDALGIPIYTPQERATLFRVYAPMWVVQTQGTYDRIGSPRWSGDQCIAVDTTKPRTYTHLSFTRFQNKILTQLNYIIWFPSRPKTDAWDIYGGLLDGINLRITLGTRGAPLIYETIHNCGCYYKAYPTRRLKVRKVVSYAEPPLILEAPAIDPASAIMAVAMESRTHFVRHLYPVPRTFIGGSASYVLVDYDELKRLRQVDGRRKSMFNRYGIVPESRRLERLILWPTGVLSPGAMREWGRHAVAFVGKRQFDDPFYLEKMFMERLVSSTKKYCPR
jgi:hypothetical protein